MIKVLCSAPFNSLTINPNKSVNPCCAWDYKDPCGNLNEQTIQEIRSSNFMQDVKKHMLEGKWHPSCRYCKNREDKTKTSVRLNVFNKISYKKRTSYYKTHSLNSGNVFIKFVFLLRSNSSKNISTSSPLSCILSIGGLFSIASRVWIKKSLNTSQL